MSQNAPKVRHSLPARAIALMLATILCIVVTGIAAAFEATILMTISTALALAFFLAASWAALRLIRDAKMEAAFAVGRAAWIFLTILFWSVAAGLAIFAVGFGVAQAAPVIAPLLLYFLAFIAVVIIVSAGAMDAVRRRRFAVVLAYVQKAIRLNLPLNRIIAVAAQSERGTLRQRLLALHDHLDRGDRLDVALAKSVPEMPLDALRAVAAADRLGRLPHLIERWFRRREREDQPFTQFIGIYQGYPVVLAACVVIVCMAALPKFHGILHDFKIHLPWSARLMEALAPAQASGAAVAIILIFLVLAPIGRGLSRVFPSAQTVLPFGGAVRDQVLWWIPFVHRYVRDRGMADMCDLLAAGIEAGRPLNECLRDCADGQGNAVLRYRLHAWADAVENGRNIHEAARYARLPSLFVRFLATARSDEDLGQVLKFLWRHYEFNFARTRAMLRAMYVPIVVLAMGILVAIVGLSLFQPLCLFINDLARQIEGGF